MIIVRLAGGLGNQLFQITLANYLVYIFNEQLVIDVSCLKNYSVRHNPDVLRLLRFENVQIQSSLARFIIPILNKGRIGRLPLPISLNDNNIKKWFSNDLRNKFGIIFLDGYFQEKITGYDFFAALELIREKVSVSLYENEIGKNFDCVMHVRGTDFLKNSVHQLVNVQYYIYGIHLIKRKINLRTINIITDDPIYAQSVVDELECEFRDIKFLISYPSQDSLEDFSKICNAKARIIPNSTFSWWASALDPKEAPTVSPLQFIKKQSSRIILNNEKTVDGVNWMEIKN